MPADAITITHDDLARRLDEAAGQPVLRFTPKLSILTS